MVVRESFRYTSWCCGGHSGGSSLIGYATAAIRAVVRRRIKPWRAYRDSRALCESFPSLSPTAGALCELASYRLVLARLVSCQFIRQAEGVSVCSSRAAASVSQCNSQAAGHGEGWGSVCLKGRGIVGPFARGSTVVAGTSTALMR